MHPGAIEWFSLNEGGMTLPPLSVWSLRRVLLAGDSGAMLRAMHAQLSAVGARPVFFSAPFSEEALCRALHQGRYACIIIPDLLKLCPGDPQARLAALNMLLGEAREAGVPLVMLLGAASCAECAPLFAHALGCAMGAQGDPVSVQCIRHAASDAKDACLGALELGARFLAGETDFVGVFALGDEAR